MRLIGKIKLVQIQPQGLIVQQGRQEVYMPERRMVVEKIILSSRGVSALDSSSKKILDIHHIDHPDKKYGPNDLISVGFTAHYQFMRENFGPHLVEGSAGENILIESDQEFWSEDLGPELWIETQSTSQLAVLQLVKFAKPCRPFSQYVRQSPYAPLEPEALKSTLQALGEGRRGFLYLLKQGQTAMQVAAGYKVFLPE